MKIRPKILLGFSLIFVLSFTASSYVAHTTIESSLHSSDLSDMQTDSVLKEVGNSIMITSLVIGIFAVLTMFWVSDRIALPIKKLDSQLKSQQVGKKLRNIEVKRNYIDQNDEISEVIYTINSMINQINELEEKKEDGLAILSHELKTPMFAILGFAQILQKPKIMGALNPTQEKSLKIINKNIVALKVMIMDLLDYQKIDLQGRAFQYTTVDSSELLEKLRDNHQKHMYEKQIEFLISTPGKILIKTDRERVEHVFDHLILNAIDFVPQKGGIIEIGVQPTFNKGIHFFVKDNGAGISIEKQKELFKKTKQDRTISRKHGGTGLGLAICKGIINGLGGEIWVESEENKGSVFNFTLPSWRK